MTLDDEVWPIALPFLARDFIERLASERDMTPEALVVEFVEAGVRAERAKAGIAVALSIACPRCKAARQEPCKRGSAARVFAPVPHAVRLTTARAVREHGSIGSEF